MKFIQFLKTKEFRKHLLIAIVSIGILLFIAFKGVSSFTKHGQTVTVPDLKGMPIEDATQLLEEQSFRYIVDSIYTDVQEEGSVFEQDPDANAQVKENRTIYLTIVSSTPPTVKLPDLIDVSLREAKAILESYGLKVGQLIYKPDLAQNAVLGLNYKGQSVGKGFQLSKGATIDLVLGDGYGNLKVVIPNLVGLSYEEALFVLRGSKLTIGSVIFDGNSNDTLSAKIYKQSPAFSNDSILNKISQGEAIDLFLREE